MQQILISLLSAGVYFVTGLVLFILNLSVFEMWSRFDVRKEIFQTQNRALGLVVRGQIIAQGILIASLIFFTGHPVDASFLNPNSFTLSLANTIGFWLLGIALMQGTIFGLLKIRNVEKEILIDHNEALAFALEAFLIALSLIVSVALYSY